MKRGLQKEFLALLEPLAPAIQAYVRHLAWNPTDIPDIFQTALMNAFQKFSLFQRGTNFKAWIFKFVTHAAFNANRKFERADREDENIADTHPEAAIEKLEEDLAYHDLLHHPEILRGLMSEKVSEAVIALSPRRRGIFLLRSVGDCSYQEIAHILDIPAGTVMGELYRARQELRKKLTAYVQENRLIRKEGGHELP